MKIKQMFIDFVLVFIVTLVVTVVVTFLWNILAHANTIVDWETSFRLAIVLGIVLPFVKVRENVSTGK